MFGYLKFLNFFKKNNSIICIDVGYRNIKIVEVEVKRKNRIVILNYGMIQTPIGVIKNGAISNVPKVLELLKEVIVKHNMKATKAKIIMSGTNIITRIYMMDKVKGEDYETTIKNSISTYLPVNINEYRIDYKILQIIKENDNEKYKVFLTGVPTNILNSYVEILFGLSLKPLAVDIPANSIAKFFNRDIEIRSLDENANVSKSDKKDVVTELFNPQDSFAVIDFGSETTIVNFLQNRVLEFNKVLLSGSSNIDMAIANEIGVPLDEAEKLKKMYGLIPPNKLSSEEHEAAHEVIRDIVEKNIKQIVKCFEFYMDRLYGTQISKIYVIGGGSQLLGLIQYLNSVFKVPVYTIGLLNLNGIELKSNLDKNSLFYLINSVGISL